MKSNISCSLYPTIVTPFLEDGNIDYVSLAKLIELFKQNNVDGVFAVCQSSEMFFLDDEEKLTLAAFTIDKCHELGLKCVVSGHTQDELEDQIKYLKRLEALNPDAIILVNNRLASSDEPEEMLLKRLEEILAVLNSETRLGIYECPYPYKRLITDALLDAMLEDGRFDFVKDTCCQRAMIKHRLEKLGSDVALYNANAATLYESMNDGAAGYSGIMLNIIPECFAQFKKSIVSGDEERAQLFSNYISVCSVIEYQNYPANAKYLLTKRHIFKTSVTRNGKPPLTESQHKENDAFMVMNELMMKNTAI